MATFYGSNGTQYQVQFDLWLISQDTVNNTSLVGWQSRTNKLSGSGYFGSYSASATVNGSTVMSQSGGYDFRGVSGITWNSGSITVAHNADGTKTVSGSTSITGDASPAFGSGSASGSLALPTIPRASVPTLSAPSVDAGSTITINTNRASTSFTHTITYDFGTLTNQSAGLSGSPAGQGITTSATFTPPMALLNEIPNAVSGTGTIRVATYNGATLIGTNTISFTLTVPTSVIPTIGSLTVAEATTSPNVSTLIGGYVQNVSTLGLTINSPLGAYNSTIVSYKLTVDGQTINSASGTTTPITSSGTVGITAEVTDSRGRKSSFPVTNITVLPYTPPVISTAEARRSISGGTVDQTNGTFIRVDMAAAVQSLIVGSQKNELQYRISTSPYGTNTWTVRVGPTSSGASTLAFDSYNTPNPYVQITAGAPYSISSSFDVRIEVIDKLTTTTVTRTVATGITLIDMNGNSGVGFGKYHQFGTIDSAGDVYQGGYPVVDFNDLATTSLPGIQRDATGAEVITGTAADRTVTPLALQSLTATDTRRGLVELATAAEALAMTDTDRAVTPVALRSALKQPLQGVMASSLVVGSGSASQSADGTITFTGVSSLSLNNIFDGLGGDTYMFYFSCLSSNDLINIIARWRTAAGVDLAGGTSYGAQYAGVVSSATSVGGTSGGTLSSMYLAYGRTLSGQTAYGVISQPATTGLGTLHTNTHGYNYVVYNMGNFGGSGTAYTGMTILPSVGTITGTVKIVKMM